MDALDEFFSQWCEPEAWCELCGEWPAWHVVHRDLPGPYRGSPTCVRIWEPVRQQQVAVCRGCRRSVGALGQRQQPPQPWFQRLWRKIRRYVC